MSCHGASGGKSALGKSRIIQGMDRHEAANALFGYQDGSYGGSMRFLMKGQVGSLSDDDIKALAAHISNL